MAMSKKDYEAIAKVIDEVYTEEKELWATDRIIVNLTLKLAMLFESDNERFDTTKFIKAAQVQRFKDLKITS